MPVQASIRDHVYICPNDLMVLRSDLKTRASIRSPRCAPSVTPAPSSVLGSHLCEGYADFVPLGASVQPKRVEGRSHLDSKFRDGRELHFTYPSRSTPVGSSEPYKNFSEDPAQDLRSQTPVSPEAWRGSDYLHSAPLGFSVGRSQRACIGGQRRHGSTKYSQ